MNRRFISTLKANALPRFPTYINDITRAFDRYNKYLLESNLKSHEDDMHTIFVTYLLGPDKADSKTGSDYEFYIRVPGATRGVIYTTKIADGEYRIDQIEFNDDTSFGEILGTYLPAIKDEAVQYIGDIIAINQ